MLVSIIKNLENNSFPFERSMCSGPEQLKPECPKSVTNDMNDRTETPKSDVSLSRLLELAAANDVQGFKQLVIHIPSAINEFGIWYGHQKISKQMLLQHRTPLMIAATYGSIDVVKLILSFSEANVNLCCSPDKITALHCAASSGSANAFDVVKLLLHSGADTDSFDVNGHRPLDVIFAPPNLPGLKFSLEQLLGKNDFINQEDNMQVSKSIFTSPEKKEYPVDPSLPDIKSGVFSTDEFRMFSFKIRPCSRAYSHDWTECPFIHPGENARRRDPRKFHYSCVPCPDFRKGQCRRGDLCEYAHGVFECWLHPAQYRTRLCKDGIYCARRVCFFAHTSEELRPLYVSAGSAVSVMSPSFTPPMSPSTNAIAMAWPQFNVPTLHLPGNNIQTSRLSSSFNARDIPPEELNMLLDFELQQQQQQLFNDMSNLNVRSKPLAPSNLDELFSAEVSSPRFSDPIAGSAVFSPSHKSLVLNQLHTNLYSPKVQASYGVSSPGIMSPRAIEPQSTPVSSRVFHREQLHHSLGVNLPHEPGSNGSGSFGSPVNFLSNWEYTNGKVDWSVNGDELARARRSFSNGHSGTEPDLSWVHSLVKESPPRSEIEDVPTAPDGKE